MDHSAISPPTSLRMRHFAIAYRYRSCGNDLLKLPVQDNSNLATVTGVGLGNRLLPLLLLFAAVTSLMRRVERLVGSIPGTCHFRKGLYQSFFYETRWTGVVASFV